MAEVVSVSRSDGPGLGLGLETYKGLDNNTDAFTILSALASRLGLAPPSLFDEHRRPLAPVCVRVRSFTYTYYR